jgi:hypothetical protein
VALRPQRQRSLVSQTLATHRAAMKTLQQKGRLWGPKLLSLKLNAARTIEK